MNSKTFLLAIILSIFIYSCSRKQAENKLIITEQQQRGKLNANIQKTQIPFLLPITMFLVEDKLLIHKLNEDYLFDVYDVSECKYLYSSGVRGQGPNDFLQLYPRSFHVYGNEFKAMDHIFLKTVLVEDNQLIVKKSEMISIYRFANGFYPLADSVYLTLGDAGETNEYALYDKRNVTLQKKGEYPKWISTNSDDPVQDFFTYIKNCVVHPDGKKFAAFYGRFKRWRIYDQFGEMIHDIDVQIPPYTPNIAEGSQFYIGQPQAIGNYIYVLCSNIERKQSDKFHDSELQIWDWDGNFIGRFSFDRKISMFVVSEKHNKIIALDQLIEDELYIYDLPLLNKK